LSLPKRFTQLSLIIVTHRQHNVNGDRIYLKDRRLFIVDVLQQQKHLVGRDGVNHVPALKPMPELLLLGLPMLV
jgi:hypothetical protein